MADDTSDFISEENFPRFGTVAVRLGYITKEQLQEALIEQIDDNLSDRKKHRPIGIILYSNGLMSKQQINKVLDEIQTMKCNPDS